MHREGAPRSALTELLRRPKVPPEWGKLFNIWVHDDNISDLELVINPELFPAVQPGDCIVITDHNTTKRFIVCVPSVERGPFKQRSFQLSIHQHLADRFGLKSRQNIYVRKLELPEIPIAETIVISFRDQYIGRIPMRIVRDHLHHRGTYTNKTIDLPSACRRAKVISMITSDGKNIESGLCSDSCQAIFRSEAAKILLLIQLSPELWQVEPETGKTVFEVKIGGFLESLAQRWKEQGTNHLISIIMSAYCASTGQQRHEDYYSIPQYWMAQPAPDALASLIVKEAQVVLAVARRDGKVLAKPNDLNVLQDLAFSLKLIKECNRDRDLSKTGMSITIINGEGTRLADIPPKDHPLLMAIQNQISSYGIFTQQVSTSPFKESEEGLATPTWLHNYECIDGALRLSKGYKACEAVKSLSVTQPIDGKPSLTDAWSNLVMPHCLTLQSGYRLSDDSLQTEWDMVAKYRINAAPASLFLEASGGGLLELQEQVRDLRLALGFQEATYQGVRKASCYVFGNELHLLSSEDTAIEAERYRYKCPDEPSKSIDHPWRALVRSEFASDYRHMTFSTVEAERELDYPWEVVDNMIAGNDMREEKSSSYWQGRFLLIPADEAPRNSLIMATAANEILDDEELRLAGFIKFCEAFQRAALSRPSPTSSGSDRLRYLYPGFQKLSSIEFLKIQFTTQSCTTYARQELDKLEASRDGEGGSAKVPLSPTKLGERDDDTDEEDETKVEHVAPLNTTDPLGHIAVMMQHPLFGLRIKNRRWHWRIYRSVFVGSMAVDWILKFFTDIQSREGAVEFGNVLLDAGVWEHIFGTHGFLDGYYYYRFGINFDLKTLRLNNPKILKTVSSKGDMNPDQADAAINSPLPLIPTDQDEKPGLIVMSRSMLITTDTHRQSPGRREWAFLHYDSSHNPRNAFHFRLHWSTCSSRLIDELVQSWSRRAAQCGFMLVEAPVEDPRFGEPSCIDSLMVMELACAPPKLEELQERLGQELGINKMFFMEELLRSHGFVLDHESDSRFPEYDSPHNNLYWSYSRRRHERTQYIHRSGVALVQIDKDRLLWIPNRLFLATSSGRCLKKSQQFQFYELEKELRTKLAGLCADADALEEFWRGILGLIGEKVGIDSILDNIPDNMTERGDDWDESPESIFDRIAMLEDMVKHSL